MSNPKVKPSKSTRKKKRKKRNKQYSKKPSWSGLTDKQFEEQKKEHKKGSALHKKGYRYHGYAKTKKNLQVRKNAYGKGYKLRSIKTKSISSGKTKYVLYAKKK